ncbi:bifunctional lytic transglycosylase/C40 family peptidase (plasmid) [Embleya sp. NBC_00888]|uniref:C40 family peptidase n=1 Tax=Embleya sp. NBC_00888 TaxID=2975960 RepID=UPI002F91102B|nr:bifunctional lytic transglycosylase/C40 family peptidase [Embleya sp. NBC_00888]
MAVLGRVALGCGGAFLALVLLAGALVAAVVDAIGDVLTGGGVASSLADASDEARRDIPPGYLTLYQQAAGTCPGLSWTVLAAIGKVETDHGRSPLPGVASGANGSGARGPMQFIDSTWIAYNPSGSVGSTGGVPDVYNPADAIPAAARMLCAEGARDEKNLRGAIFAYNHADWYVTQVLDQAAKYAAPPGTDTGVGAPNEAIAKAIAFARTTLGTPYVWGGDGPAEGGYDCSGLTKAAYAAAGITLERVAQDQYHSMPRLAPGAPIAPGDLVFYGTPADVHHVGLAIDGTRMIEAPRPGVAVRVADIRHRGDDFLGATRPTAAR